MEPPPDVMDRMDLMSNLRSFLSKYMSCICSNHQEKKASSDSVHLIHRGGVFSTGAWHKCIFMVAGARPSGLHQKQELKGI